MDEQEHLKLERRLEDILHRDLGAIPVRPLAWYSRPTEARPARGFFAFTRAVGLVALVLVLALGAALALRQMRPVPASTPVPSAPVLSSPSPSVQPTPSATPSAPVLVPSPTPTGSAATTGAISGRFGYPADYIPALTVYAISVSDPSVFFSVDFAGYGNPPRPTLPPGFSEAEAYTLSGIAPGTYYVLAFRNDNNPGVGVYTQYTVKCLQATTYGQTTTPAPACAAYDQSLLPVTVIAGETARRIDIIDWNFGQKPYSPPLTRPTR